MASGWPTEQALGSFLTAAGYTTTGLELSNAVTAARSEFEQMTGWVPFLVDTVDSARNFDCPPMGGQYGGWLIFGAGLMSLTSITIDGTAQTLNTDFYLGPANADDVSRPWEWVEWVARFSCLPRGIVVTGKWGRVSDIPADVRLAVLARASAMVAPQLQAVANASPVEWTEGDVRKKYTANAVDTARAGWQREFDLCVRRWKRVFVA